MNRVMTWVMLSILILGSGGLTAESSIIDPASPIIESPGESFNQDIHVVPWERSEHWYGDWRDTTELFWDDGTPEAYYVVSGIPGIYDRFAVRFDITSPPPLKVVSGRFYTDNSVIALQSFSVCRDGGGFPDVFHPIDQVDTVYGGYPGWGQYDFHGAIFDTNDIWAVVHWIPGYVVGIGADSTAPDGNSYWCNEKTARIWNQWTATDWMMRVSVATVTDSHDVTTVALLEPPVRFLPGDTMAPVVVFGNCGLSAETFDVTFDITDSVGGLVYTATTNLSLASAEIETVTFTPDWVTFDEGHYIYTTYTSLANDADPANDTVRMWSLCSSEIIIAYCGEYTNMGSAIIGTWATNRKYLVRMTPPIPPPFYLRRAEIFLCDENAPLDYLCVCPDDGTGLPDTATILAIAHNIFVPLDHTWTTAQYGDIEVTVDTDLWVIAKWLEGITQPHIGMEINDPSTERSWRYYFRYGAGHYENMGLDPYFREWYFKLVIVRPPVGVEEIVLETGLDPYLTCQPNPAYRQLAIQVIPPRGVDAVVDIYNVAGTRVRSYDIAASELSQDRSIVWDGNDDQGRALPAGAYFVRLCTPGYVGTEKVILLR